MKTKLIVILWLTALFPSLMAQSVNRFIIVDQFGYLPESQKIAVIKDPHTGFDAAEAFTPGENYVVVDALSGTPVYRGQPVIWNSGNTDASSGDKAWHFDFSSVSGTGNYYILDSVNNVRSYEFRIASDIYHEILKQAVRTFFYQRVGFPKEAQYAGEEWADGASHMGPLQDKNCRVYNDKNNAGTARDVSGGWYDAGDLNKYTNWTSGYVVEMMKAYKENPNAWGDNYNIPESGNGIPDLLDEAKWGIDHLLRMQEPDGGVLCIVSEDGASPPSAATRQSVYGPATTSAAFNTAAALAIASRVYRSVNLVGYSDTLIRQAEKAWQWGILHPAVIFHNNSASNGSQGVGAGDQEEDDYGRQMSKLEAACFLFEATGKTAYRNYFDSNYDDAHMIQWNFAFPYEFVVQDLLLYYTTISGATNSVSNAIKNVYKNAMSGNTENFPAYYSSKDPYRAHMVEYTWGSNNQKGAVGGMFYNIIYYSIDAAKNQDARDAAEGYVHYIHGVNPLNLVYLSNMYAFGGDSSANEFYHTWFTDKSAKWDRVGTSLYGPPPGFVPGGPNPSYNWDGCCDERTCGSTGNNSLCDSENLTPPLNQPKQKSYKDFNNNWPLNSWSVTENSCGYQISYIRLLSKFVDGYDCNGVLAGTAELDTCGICSEGNTERTAEIEPCNCPEYRRNSYITAHSCGEYISPGGSIWDESGKYTDTLIADDGCDSIIFINLEVALPSAASLNIASCTEYSSPSGKYSWTESGVYTDTIINARGCDSIISIDLEILQSSEVSFNIASCDVYSSPSGKYSWAESGVYADTINNALGCDSIITVNLTITQVNVEVSQTEDTLVALASDAEFRWLNCSDDAEIIGATNARFTPQVSGEYAVEVKQSGCTDTSECFAVIITGVFYNTLGSDLKVFPNPAGSRLTILLPEPYETTGFEIKNLSGQVVFKDQRSKDQRIDLSIDIPPGLYLLSIKNNRNQGAIIKLVIE
jgi:hypothetical protein